MGQQAVARERCSFVLGQASLHRQQSIGTSVILQSMKAFCYLPLVLVALAMSLVPADKWSCCFLLPVLSTVSSCQKQLSQLIPRAFT